MSTTRISYDKLQDVWLERLIELFAECSPEAIERWSRAFCQLPTDVEIQHPNPPPEQPPA